MSTRVPSIAARVPVRRVRRVFGAALSWSAVGAIVCAATLAAPRPAAAAARTTQESRAVSPAVLASILAAPSTAPGSEPSTSGPRSAPSGAEGPDLAATSVRRLDPPRAESELRVPGLHGPGPRNLTLGAMYVGLYSGAAKVGSRLGLEGQFEIVRLESAWAMDVFGHVYAVSRASRLFAGAHRWAGDDPRTARRRGAWFAGFGSLLYMETINGFMPGVRFDWMDPISNGAGAWIADGGVDFAQRHPWAQRLSLELGYKSWSRVGEHDDDEGAFTRIWHDYPNMRFGVGYGVGPVRRPWVRMFLTYGVTSFDIEELRNQWGMGVELKPHHWLEPWIERVPGGGALLALTRWVDRQVLLPGLYVHFFDVRTGPFTGREPFDE